MKTGECVNCGETGSTCDICGTTSCDACREAVRGTKARCIQCNEIMPNLGVKGSCGSGSCDL